MKDKDSKTFSFGQVLLALGFAFILLAVTLIKKIFPFSAFEIASDILSSALLVTLILIVQPFAQKFEKNPVDGIKFISVFLFSLVVISFAFKNLINIQRVGELTTLTSYVDIISANFYNLIYAFLLSIVFSIFLKVFFYERGKEANLKFVVTFSYFAIFELLRRLFEASSLLSLLSGIQIILFIWASFRIPWVINLPKKDKYKVLLFSFLSVSFSFLLQSPFITGNAVEGMRYYSALFFSFTHFYCQPFLIIYFFFVFGSTVFHLPTGEIYERRVTELSTLQNIGKLVARVLDIKDFSETSVKIAMEITNSKSAWVEVRFSNSAQIYGRFGIGEDEMLRVMGQISHIREKFGREYFKESYHIEDLESKIVLVAPLVAHDKVLGLLYLMRDGKSYNQDEINLALAFADQIAIGIENSRLIQESIEKERLAREFELARQMQEKLLPKSLPVSEKFEISALSIPAFEVGGDYYDFVIHNNGNISLIAADVSGKGVSAAFYMAEIKGIFQTLAKIHPKPVDFLAKMNDTILGHIDKKFFITLVYAYFDLQRNVVHIARAGHLPPVLVKGGTLKFLKLPGASVGLMPTHSFRKLLKTLKFKLEKDDLLIFYSDGIIEAVNELNEEFGYERLKKVIVSSSDRHSNEIVNTIYREVINYQGEIQQVDDITIVAVKWKK